MTVDIDGTLTTVHGWHWIAKELGKEDAWESTKRRFFAHEIGEDEHLADLLAIAGGRTLAEVESTLESTPRLHGIAAGVRQLQADGIRVALLTHNPTYVGAWYRGKFGFDEFEGTPGQSVVEGVIGRPDAIRADKPGGLRALIARTGVAAGEIVHIGDGWADAAIFRLVGGGIALNSALPEVDRAADLVLHTNDFRTVAGAVESLRPRA